MFVCGLSLAVFSMLCFCVCRHRGVWDRLGQVSVPLLQILQTPADVGRCGEGVSSARRPPDQHPVAGGADLCQPWVCRRKSCAASSASLTRLSVHLQVWAVTTSGSAWMTECLRETSGGPTGIQWWADDGGWWVQWSEWTRSSKLPICFFISSEKG